MLSTDLFKWLLELSCLHLFLYLNPFFFLYCDLTRCFIIIITPKHMSVGCTRVYEVGADEMAVRNGWKKR